MKLKHYSFFCFSALLLFQISLTTVVAKEEHHIHQDHVHKDSHEHFEVVENTAHQHGLAHAEISLDNQQLHITVRITAEDALSTRQAHDSEDKKTAISHLADFLQNPESLFLITPNCEITLQPKEDELTHTIEQFDAGHNDIEAVYHWDCSRHTPQHLDFILFDSLPSVQSLHVQFISENLQENALLTRDHRRLTLAP